MRIAHLNLGMMISRQRSVPDGRQGADQGQPVPMWRVHGFFSQRAKLSSLWIDPLMGHAWFSGMEG